MPYARHDGTEVFPVPLIGVAYYPVPGGVVMRFTEDLPGPAVFIPNVHLRCVEVEGEQLIDLEAG